MRKAWAEKSLNLKSHQVLCLSGFARADRGRGRPAVHRISPSFQKARELLESFTTLAVIDVTEPVACKYAEMISALASHAKMHSATSSELDGALHKLAHSVLTVVVDDKRILHNHARAIIAGRIE